MDEFEKGVRALIDVFGIVKRDVGTNIALGRDVDTFQMLPAKEAGAPDMVLEVTCLPSDSQAGGPFAPTIRELTVAYRPVGGTSIHEVEARLEMVDGLSLQDLLLRSPDVFHLASFGNQVAEKINHF